MPKPIACISRSWCLLKLLHSCVNKHIQYQYGCRKCKLCDCSIKVVILKILSSQLRVDLPLFKTSFEVNQLPRSSRRMSSVRKHLVGSPEWWSHWKRIIGVEEPLECAVSVEVTKLGQLKTTEFSFYSKVYLKVVVKDARLSDALNCEGFDLQLNWDNALSTLVRTGFRIYSG